MTNMISRYARVSACCVVLALTSVPAYSQFMGDKQAKLVVTEPVSFMSVSYTHLRAHET